MKAQLTTIFDYYVEAQKKLSWPIEAYINSQTHGETLFNNKFDHLQFYPHILQDVSTINTKTTIGDVEIGVPIISAPMAFHCLLHKEAEVATASAIALNDTIYTSSLCSSTPFQKISQASRLSPWFQLYIYKDREITKNFIRMAERNGFSHLVLTVDAPYYGKRLAEIHHPFSIESSTYYSNFVEAGLDIKNIPLMDIPQYLTTMLDPRVTWHDLEWLRKNTILPIILKGVLREDDILKAIQHDIRTIIISNHGGRQLDSSIYTLTALKNARKLIQQHNIEVILDGNIRKGSDILKSIALGAKAVMVGRPLLWGLAVEGKKGVQNVMKILTSELKLCMALCGVTCLHDSIDKIIFDRNNAQ